MTDLKNDLEQTLISEGTKAMMLKLKEESYRQGVNDTLQSAIEAAEKALVLGIEQAVKAEREACAKLCEEIADSNETNGYYEWVTGNIECAKAIRARGSMRGERANEHPTIHSVQTKH